MKIKETILQNKIGYPVGDSLEGRLLAAMDDYSKQQSIEFAKWLNKEGWEEYDESDRWICPSNNRNVYTTEQLYKKFTQ